MALTFRQHQLSNGLEIIAEENPDSHSFAAGIFVKTGCRAMRERRSTASRIFLST